MDDAGGQPDFRAQADENLEKWGQQPPAELALALTEELAEVCEMLFAYSEPGDGSSPVGDFDNQPQRGRQLIFEQMNLGFEIREYLEETCEDEDGNPIPVDERPAITGDIVKAAPIREEIQDIGALCHQLDESVVEYADDE